MPKNPDVRFCKCHLITMPMMLVNNATEVSRKITYAYLDRLCEDHRMLYDNLTVASS